MYRVAAFSQSQPVNLNYVKDQLLNGKPLIPADLKPSWKGQTVTVPTGGTGPGNTVIRLSYPGTTGKSINPLGVANNIGPNFQSKSAGWISGTTATSSRPFDANAQRMTKGDEPRWAWGQLNLSDIVDPFDNPNTLIADISNSRALQRYTGIYTSNRSAQPRRQNPIRHWRRQLIPSQGHVTGKPRLNDVISRPGGTSYLSIDYKKALDSSCCSVNFSPQWNSNGDQIEVKSLLTQNLFGKFVDMSNCNCNPQSGLPNVDVIRNEMSNFQPVYFNNPSRITRPKSSQTILKKNYYTTTKAYLKSRVKLYDQNQLLSNINQQVGQQNALIMQNGQPLNQRLPPSNTNWVYANQSLNPQDIFKKGSQAFNSTYCVSDASACCPTDYMGRDAEILKNMSQCQVPVTYKPNNPFFSTQGAVDSSTRILQAKYGAITKNNYDFNRVIPDPEAGESLYVYSLAGDKNSDIIRLPGSTPMKYVGESYRSAAPYFIKSKYQRINACYQGPKPRNYWTSIHSRNRLNGIGNRMPSGGTGVITTCFYVGH